MTPSHRTRSRTPASPLDEKRRKYEAAADVLGHLLAPVVFHALRLFHEHVSELLMLMANFGTRRHAAPLSQTTSFISTSQTCLVAVLIAGSMRPHPRVLAPV